MKLIIRLLTLLVLLSTGLTSYAYDIEVDGIYYNIFASTKTAKVTYGNSLYTNQINIPESINYGSHSLMVVGVDDEAFKDCTSLTIVNLPKTVTSIGASAFCGCTSLTTINLPETITIIDQGAFSGCSSITNVNLPKSVTSIGPNAFSGCTSLTDIDLPESIIGSNAFNGCSSLTNVNLPKSLAGIPSGAFSGCSSLSIINLPESVTYVGRSAFAECTSLTSMNMPESLTKIDDYAFSVCTSLTTISLPSFIEEIGRKAFYGCVSLKRIDIPNSVTSIGFNAFKDCNLTLLSIGSGIKMIGWDEYSEQEGRTSLLGCAQTDTLEIKSSSTALKLGGHDGDRTLLCDWYKVKIKNLIIRRPILYLYKYEEKHKEVSCSSPFAGNPYIETLELSGNFSFGNMSDYENYYDGSYLDWSWKDHSKIPYLPNLKELIIVNTNEDYFWNNYISKDIPLERLSVTGIGYIEFESFKDFSHLKYVQLKDVYTVKSDVFLGCDSLKEIEIHGDVNSLSNSIVSCPLETITFYGKNPPSSNNFPHEAYLRCSLIVPHGCVDTYKQSSPWSNFWTIEEMPPLQPKSIVLNESSISLKEKESFQLIATISPEEANDNMILWTSSDEKVVHVSDVGLISGISEGQAIVTASCGEISASCNVKILGESGIENIYSDSDSKYSVYSIDGTLIMKDCSIKDIKGLLKGIYIIVSKIERFKISI